MAEEPWDELMGPRDGELEKMLTGGNNGNGGLGNSPLRATHSFDNNTSKEEKLEEIPMRRSISSSTGTGVVGAAAASAAGGPPPPPPPPPPPEMFNRMMPDRWSQYEDDADRESGAATVKAVATASEKAALRESLVASAEEILSELEMEQDAASSSNHSATSSSSHHHHRRRFRLPPDDDDDETDGCLYQDHHRGEDYEGSRIRQEALKMLEVADDQLSGSTYSVHRTISGGFMASAKPLGNKKRVPSALSGLNFTAAPGGGGGGSNKNLDRPYRDDPYALSEDTAAATPKATREDYEYGDDNIVDVVGMESRSACSRPASENNKSNSWSSRYSVDSTLLNMSGGSKQYLDRLDNEHERQASRNVLFASSSPRAPAVFGSGFSFRQQNVFGKQNATVPPQSNLYEIEKGTGATTPPMPLSPDRTKSWQDQLQQKRNQRRRWVIILLGLMVLAIVLAVSLSTTTTSSDKSKGSSSQSNAASNDEDASTITYDVDSSLPATTAHGVTFYVTSDVPFVEEDEDKLMADLDEIKDDTKFVFHLGNIQVSSETRCDPSRYEYVSTFLQQSPVPIFLLPGAEDWTNCPDPEAAWQSWMANLNMFDTHFDTTGDLHVTRHKNHSHNFAFVHGAVLFVGLHLVNGKLYKWDESIKRGRGNFAFLNRTVADNEEHIRAIVVLGSARPGMPHNREFFESMSALLKERSMPSIYIHSNNGIDGQNEYRPFDDATNILAVEAIDGGVSAPLRIHLDDDGNTKIDIGNQV